MIIYSNTDMCRAIDEYVHNIKHRELLRLKLCDGYTHEEVAERVGYSTQYVKEICREYKPIMFQRL